MMRRLTALLFLVLLASCGGRHEIVSGLKEKEANEIIVFLASYNIDAQKAAASTGGVGGGNQEQLYSVTVPSSQGTEALALLNKAGLPRRSGASLLSLFKKSALVSSAQEEQIRYQEGLGEQIAGTIRMIDGVVDAVVQISTPQTETTSLAVSEEQKGPVRASVYVKHTGVLDDPNSQLVTKIKRLVAASVVGLDFENVTVISDRARYTDISLEGESAFLPQEELDYERIWSIIVWKGSVGAFRTLFVILSLVIFVLAVFSAWLVWKLYPCLQQGGGISKLFTSFKPIYPEGYVKKKGEEEEEEEYFEEEE